MHHDAQSEVAVVEPRKDPMTNSQLREKEGCVVTGQRMTDCNVFSSFPCFFPAAVMVLRFFDVEMFQDTVAVTEEVLHLLSAHPLTESQQEMVLDALATVVHSHRMTTQDRVILSGLADLLHCAWAGTWQDLPSGGEGIKLFRRTVPDLDPEIWPKVLIQKELNRSFFGFAATSVRGLIAALSAPVAAKTLLRELSWMDIAQRELSTESQILDILA